MVILLVKVQLNDFFSFLLCDSVKSMKSCSSRVKACACAIKHNLYKIYISQPHMEHRLLDAVTTIISAGDQKPSLGLMKTLDMSLAWSLCCPI